MIRKERTRGKGKEKSEGIHTHSPTHLTQPTQQREDLTNHHDNPAPTLRDQRVKNKFSFPQFHCSNIHYIISTFQNDIYNIQCIA